MFAKHSPGFLDFFTSNKMSRSLFGIGYRGPAEADPEDALPLVTDCSALFPDLEEVLRYDLS